MQTCGVTLFNQARQPNASSQVSGSAATAAHAHHGARELSSLAHGNERGLQENRERGRQHEPASVEPHEHVHVRMRFADVVQEQRVDRFGRGSVAEDGEDVANGILRTAYRVSDV